MDYIAQPKDYWIAPNAINITRNALGKPNRIQCSVVSGAAILCYIEGVDGLGYDNGHRFRTWSLTISPTYFNSNTEKYVYVAIPRSASVGTQAVVVFPSEKLDIYGVNANDEQVGSTDYYYIWLQGIITATDGTSNREWRQAIDFGKKGTDEDLYDDTSSEWFQYSKVNNVVTFLKNIRMKAGTTFQNLILGYKELTGVATADTSDEFVDSETLVVTPSYLKKNTEDKFLRKDQDDATPYSLTVGGNLSVGGILRAVTGYFTSLYSNLVQSTNYTGDGIADTGYRLTADDGTGSSALTVDNLHVRKKATFEELEVKKETSVAGNEIRSAAANVINRTDYIDQNGEVIGYSYTKVPWMLKKMPFLLRHRFFGRLRRVRITIDPEHVGDIKKIRCYFLAKDGDRDVKNLWRAHDLVRCQTFNISRSNRFTYIGTKSQSKAGNVFWWRKALLVSTSPVAIDDKEYHYFDVSMDDCAADSDIPCAGDHAVQFGNDSDSERMNLIIQEVNGDDAPAIKAYTGIYTYDLNKCWWGGSPRKMMLSPKSGYEFYGPSFKFVQEYGQAPASIDRGAWVDIPTGRDDYEPHAQVRKCYYNDKVSHNGCYWLCVMSQVGAHWVDASGNYLTQAQYDALPADQKLLCTRRQNYVTSQPGTDNTAWKKLVDKGDNMVRLDISNEMDTVQTDSTGKVTAQRTVTTVVRLYDGSSEVAINNPTVTGISYTDANGQQQTLQPTITASGNGRQLSWTFQTGWTLQGRYQVSIGYTYQNVPYTAVFTLTASQGMAIFQLKPALTAIPFQRDADGNLTPASKSLALDIIKIDGASTATLTPATYGRTKIRYSLTEMPTLVTSGTAWPSTGSISVPNTAENVYIALFNIYDGLIDRESVPVIKDGEKGEMGSDGPYYVDDYGIGASRASHSDISSWSSSQPEPTAQKPYVWKRSRLYNPNTGAYGNATYVCLTGERGVNGKDGWMITANPANVIITQSLNNNTNSFSSATVSFSAKKGSASATITSVGTPASSEFNVSKSGNTVVVSSPKKHGNPAEYYSEGSFTVTINVTDPDTGSTVSFSVTVLCYANLLGTWKESVEAGTKTEVARSLTYGYDPKAGEVIPIENFGSFIKSSEENISTISRQINDPTTGLVTQISTIDQKADRISLSVEAAFKRTGIDIENGLIKATTDNFVICNSSGTPTFSVDPDGNLVSSGSAKFSGTIEAKGGTIGGFSIGEHKINSSNNKIVLNDDGTATIGGLLVTGTKTSFNGEITATSGEFTGDVKISSSSGSLIVGADNKTYFKIGPSSEGHGEILGFAGSTEMFKISLFQSNTGNYPEIRIGEANNNNFKLSKNSMRMDYSDSGKSCGFGLSIYGGGSFYLTYSKADNSIKNLGLSCNIDYNNNRVLLTAQYEQGSNNYKNAWPLFETHNDARNSGLGKGTIYGLSTYASQYGFAPLYVLV